MVGVVRGLEGLESDLGQIGLRKLKFPPLNIVQGISILFSDTRVVGTRGDEETLVVFNPDGVCLDLDS